MVACERTPHPTIRSWNLRKSRSRKEKIAKQWTDAFQAWTTKSKKEDSAKEKGTSDKEGSKAGSKKEDSKDSKKEEEDGGNTKCNDEEERGNVEEDEPQQEGVDTSMKHEGALEMSVGSGGLWKTHFFQVRGPFLVSPLLIVTDFRSLY